VIHQKYLLKTAILIVVIVFADRVRAGDFQRLPYNNPGLVVDLGVGLWVWPLPMDYDGDGDIDLLAACPDKPSNGIYFFENPGGPEKMPVFKPGVRLGDAPRYMHLSQVDGRPRILVPRHEFIHFQEEGFKKATPIYHADAIHPQENLRAQNWNYVDYDGDGAYDLIVGIGDWSDYGWDNAYDSRGVWKNGRLHGFVYFLKNLGTTAVPKYAQPTRIEAGGSDVDVYGWPSPNFADFDNDGDLDLVCGEFLDGFTYFENVGTRTKPQYVVGKKLTYRGEPLSMDLQMIVPVAIDWDNDGDVDLVVGQEDGRIALLEHSGQVVAGLPQFLPPEFFQQEADCVKFGADSTPVGFDWDGDGDEDILCGNSAGYIGFIENLDGGVSPKWDSPKYLRADGEVIRITVGENGSIQGPCEAKWGQTVLSIADWDTDGLPDLIVNSMWGEILWYKNIGSQQNPKLDRAKPVEVAWPDKPSKPKWNWWDPTGMQLVTQWRTTPVAVDFTGDRLIDLVMLDHEGYLALYERRKRLDRLELLPPQRVFVDEDGHPIRLNNGTVGSSGRRKIDVVDWDRDGRLDVLVDAANVDWWRNCGTRNGNIVLKKVGPLGQRELAKHSTSPTVVDWNGDALPDLLLGAEDGFLYHLAHKDATSYSEQKTETRPSREKNRDGLLAKPGVDDEEFVFTDATFQQCHSSTIAATPAGFVVAWFAGTKEGADDVGIWVSRHKGEWTDPVEVANGIQHRGKRYPCWNPVLFQVPNGPLMLFYKVGDHPSRWWGELMLSYDGGRVWTPPRRLPEGILGPINNKPILLSDGALLCGSSTEHDGWRVHFEMTRDWGTTWKRIGPVDDTAQFNAIQPAILNHTNGILQALCRSRGGRITTCWSQDAGETWGAMIATDLPNPNSGIDAVTLFDGRHLLVYNHSLRDESSPQDREVLNVAISDDGKTWHRTLTLENEADAEFSYPAVIQSDDGLVHITYTWKRQHIKHVVLNPEQLVVQKTGK